MPSEIRKDYLQQRYVLIAPHGSHQRKVVERPERLNHPSQACAFCPSAVDPLRPLLTIGNKNSWYVKTVASRFPVVSPDNQKAYGRQETIIETPNHMQQLEDLAPEHIERIFEAYAHRQRAMVKDQNIVYISISKSGGGRAQTSLEHAHSQILGTAFLPPEVADQAAQARDYERAHGRCAYCDIIDNERSDERLVYADDQIIAFTPYASFHNYEVWMSPRRHVNQLEDMNQQERSSFASVLQQLARSISGLHLPYQYSIQQPAREPGHHFYLQLAPRGTVWSGPQFSGGLAINAVSPEEAAEYYRQGLK